MADECDVSEIVTTFLLNCRLPPWSRRHRVYRLQDIVRSYAPNTDTQLFANNILHNPVHRVLQALLPPPADRNYNLRDRRHHRQLPGRM